MYCITIPRFAEISLKTVVMIPLGLVIQSLMYVLLSTNTYEIFLPRNMFCHYSKLKEKLYCSNDKFRGI